MTNPHSNDRQRRESVAALKAQIIEERASYEAEIARLRGKIAMFNETIKGIDKLVRTPAVINSVLSDV